MRHSLLTMMALVACSTVLSSVSGCMAKSRSLVRAGVLKLEKQNTGKVYIVWSDAYEHKTGFVVSGVVKRRDQVGLAIKTRVNVAILASDGTVITDSDPET